MSFVVRCLSCCSLFVACCLFVAVCGLWFVVGEWSSVDCVCCLLLMCAVC